MFEEALQTGGNIGMLTTFGPSVKSMQDEFNELAATRNADDQLTTILVEEAMTRLSEGDCPGHNTLLRQAAAEHFTNFDIVMLAQFSTAQACISVSEVFKGKILTSPKSAVLKLKQLLLEGST